MKIPRTWVVALICIALVGAAAVWAFAPLRAFEAEYPALDEIGTEPAGPSLIAPLDRAAFGAPLWIVPPAPAPRQDADAAALAAATPLKIQLLAIIQEDGAYRAMIYDPDSDRVLVVAAGQTLGARTVEAVDGLTLRIRGVGEEGIRTLSLKADGSGR